MTRAPLVRLSATFSASVRQAVQRKNDVSPSFQPSPSLTRGVTATEKLATGAPDGVNRSSGSSVRLPVMVTVVSGMSSPPRGALCWSARSPWWSWTALLPFRWHHLLRLLVGPSSSLDPGDRCHRASSRPGGSRGARRRATLTVLLLLAAAGCGQAAGQEPIATSAVGEHRFTHVHEFPAEGIRIALPTGTPRLTWQQALARSEREYGGLWDSRTPPQVKLADYRSRRRPPAQLLAWIVVYPDALEPAFGGPVTPRPRPPRVRHRCPAYVVVDATSERTWGTFQTCEPPYRG